MPILWFTAMIPAAMTKPGISGVRFPRLSTPAHCRLLCLPEEHTHAEGCYTSVRGDLVCGEHVHTDACYTETAVLACGLEESEEHQHDENCYETSRELTCGIDSDHSHTDACYEWEQVLSCDLPTESAEDAQPVLVCTKPEIILTVTRPTALTLTAN